MIANQIDVLDNDSGFAEAVTTYLKAVDAGQSPDPQEWLQRYPELAEELADFFAGQEQLDRLSAPLRALAPAPELSSDMRSRRAIADGGAFTHADSANFWPSSENRIFGDYQLLEVIARGGMGIVYKARHGRLNRIVALKLILAGQFAKQSDVERFQTEAEAAASLDHPHIVPIYEVGEEKGQHYFSMKLIEGQNLAQRLSVESAREGKTLAEPQTPVRLIANSETRRLVKILATVAGAVHYSHQHAILHRDLKPANILLDSADQPYVTDFGLAKLVAADQTATQSGAIIGTASYMAPEQAAGSKGLTTSADIYSLGAILYEVLTGRPPFREETALETLLHVREREPARPSDVHPKVDRDLETICLKCLERDPLRRYGSAEGLAEELHRWLAGEPIHARPVGRIERLRRWGRCNPAPAVASLLGLVAFTAVVALGVGSVFAMQLGEEQERTQAALQQAEEQQQETKAALQKAEAAKAAADEQRGRAGEYLRQTERLATTLTMERGLHLCEQGDVARGLLWLARSLQRAPDHAADLQRAIRASLAGWQHQNHALKHVLLAKEQIADGDISPDGKTIVTGGYDGTVQLWDTALGKPLGVPVFEQKGLSVRHVAFSPDGKTFLTVGHSNATGEARLWEASTAKPIGGAIPNVRDATFSADSKTVLTTGGEGMWGRNPKISARLWEASTAKSIGGPIPTISRATLSPDGKTILTASDDGTARLWDSATGNPLGIPLHEQKDSRVEQMAFSPDGKTIVTIARISAEIPAEKFYDSTLEVRLWDAATQQPRGLLIQPRGILVLKMAFSSDSKTLVTVGSDETARLWDLTTGKPLGSPLPHHSQIVDLDVSPDGKWVLTGGIDGTARLWDSATGQPCFAPLQHPSRIWSVAFGPDSKTILTTGQEVVGEGGAARIWEIGTGQTLGPTLQHNGPVIHAAFSPDGRAIGTGAVPSTTQLWDAQTGQELFTVKDATLQGFSPDGTMIVTTKLAGDLSKGLTGEAKLWSTATGQVFGALMPYQGFSTAVSFSPDGRTVATASQQPGKSTGQARLWETATGQPLGPPLVDDQSVWDVEFSPDGKSVLVSGDKSTQLFETATGKLVYNLQLTGRNFLAVFSPDGQTILTGSSEGTVQLWESATGKPRGLPMQHQGPLTRGVFSPDGRTVVTGSLDTTARLWEAATGKPLGRPLAHRGQVHAVAFSPDGQTVVTASLDKTARLWEAATGQPLGPPLQHNGPVRHVAFSPEGTRVLTGSDDRTARLWQLPTPVTGDAERIVLWTQVITGMELDSDDIFRLLDARTWEQRRQRLQELSGPTQ